MESDNFDYFSELLKKQAEKEETKNHESLSVQDEKLQKLKDELDQWQEKLANPERDPYKRAEGIITEITRQIDELEKGLGLKTSENVSPPLSGEIKAEEPIITKKEVENNFAYGNENFGTITAEDLEEKISGEKIAGVERLTGAGTEKQEEILDSEYIPKDEKKFAMGDENFGTIKADDLQKNNILEAGIIGGAILASTLENGGKIETKQEQKENLEKSESDAEKFNKELANARKEFVEMDYKKTRMRDRVSQYFKSSKLDIKDKKDNEDGVMVKDKDGNDTKEKFQMADDSDVTYMQALYDNALINYKNSRIIEIEKLDLPDDKLEQELKKLTIEIGQAERASLMDEKLEIKAKEIKGTNLETGKNIFKKSVDWYKSLGWKKQLAITAGLVAGGGAVALGAAAGVAGCGTLAACFAGATMLKRGFGGAATAVGAFGAAEWGASVGRNAGAKMEVNKVVSEFSNSEIESLRKSELRDNKTNDIKVTDEEFKNIVSRELSKEDRFKIIKSRMDKIAFETNNKVEKQKGNTILRASGAAIIGTLVGSGVLSSYISEKFGLGEKIQGLIEQGKHTKIGGFIMDRLSGIMENANHSTAVPDSAKGAFMYDSRLETPNSDALYGEPPKVSEVNFAEQGKINPLLAENIPAHNLEGIVMINEGSSIEKTLNEMLKAQYPDIEGRGAVAHKMFQAYMQDQIKYNPDGLSAEKLAEYKEMLATGRMNIQPGAELKIIEINGKPVLSGIKGDIKMFHGGVVHLGGNELPEIQNTPFQEKTFADGVDGFRSDDIMKKINEFNAQDLINKTNTQDLIDKALEEHREGEILAAQNAQDLINKTNTQDLIDKALEEHREVEFLAANQKIFDAQDRFNHFNEEYKSVIADTSGYQDGSPSIDQSHEMYVADEARKAAANDVERLTGAKDMHLTELKNSFAEISEKTGYKWSEIKDLDYSNAYADDKLNPIIKQLESDYKKEFGEKIYPRNNETFGRWLSRIKEISIKKRLNILIQ